MDTAQVNSSEKPANPLCRAWHLVWENRRAYLGINLFYYGLVVLGMIYVAVNPALQEELIKAVGQTLTEGPLASVGEAYGGGQVLSAIALTFGVNLLIGSFVTITLPSLLIPFSGLLMGIYRAVLWGLLLSPANSDLAGPMIPHSITLLLEGQAYVLALLAVYIQGRAFLLPKTVGAESRRGGYWEGLKRTALLYLLLIILLAVAAIYEALEVIFLVPLL